MRGKPEAASQTKQQEDDPRLVAMEHYESKRRLIRDAKALGKLRKITQRQMAEEIGVPRRTLEEWLQFRRMPQAPSEALLRLWVSRQTSHC
jgi:DNA-binding transcriptional regulator YiaG